MSAYPEHDKQHLIHEDSQVIGEFLDTCGYELCEWRAAGNNGEDEYVWTRRALKARPSRADHTPRLHDFIDGRAEHNPEYEGWDEGYVPVGKSIQRILAKHFGIDLDKIEDEKRAMIDALRS